MKLLYDYVRINQMTMQTWTACLQTISLRAELISTNSPLSTRVMEENLRMSTEKISASFEIYSQLHLSTLDMYAGRFNPLTTWEKMLKPINKKAVTNAQRLSKKTKKT